MVFMLLLTILHLCRILGWQPEKSLDSRPRHERVVIIKHAFLPEEFEVSLLNLSDGYEL